MLVAVAETFQGEQYMGKLSAIGGAVVSAVSTTAGLIGDTRALLYTDKILPDCTP